MAKPLLHLVPTAGKKLADVAANIELQAALVSTLLLAVLGDNPKIKDKMLFELRAILARSNLSPHQWRRVPESNRLPDSESPCWNTS